MAKLGGSTTAPDGKVTFQFDCTVNGVATVHEVVIDAGALAQSKADAWEQSQNFLSQHNPEGGE